MSQSPTDSLATIEDNTLYGEGVYREEVSREEISGEEQSQVSDTAVRTSTRCLPLIMGSQP
jgi:hypothetical protein